MENFNTILDTNEKRSETPFNPNSSIKFHNTLDRCGLMDMGSCGPRFTWRVPLFQNYERVFKCLDKVVYNAD